jgi:GTP pyrophosphokinase
VAARVDRRRVPLRTTLRNGQTVEITTKKGATPNPVWLNFVVTAKARTAIKNFLKRMRDGEAIALGKRLLGVALQDLGVKKITGVDRARLDEVLAAMQLEDQDALFMQIGLGQQLAPLVARRLVADDELPQGVADAAPSPITIAGTEGMVVTFGRCCSPIPGDPIMGHLSAGRGVVVHRNECGNLNEFRKQPDKWIAVAWESGIDQEFTVLLRVDCLNELGVLAAVAARISEAGSNIEHVTVLDKDGDASAINFIVQVRDFQHLSTVMRRIETMPEVLRVTRVCD